MGAAYVNGAQLVTLAFSNMPKSDDKFPLVSSAGSDPKFT